MRSTHTRTRMVAIAAVISGSLLLASCGGGTDYELNLPGLGNVLANGKAKEPKMVKRSGLLIPPDLNKGLPAPGQPSIESQNLSWPKDPEVARRQALAAAKKKKQDYKDNGNIKSYSGVEEFNKNQDWIARQDGFADQMMKDQAPKDADKSQ